jgi:hypothetical protein
MRLRQFTTLTAAASLAGILVSGAAQAGPNLLTNGDFASAITSADTDYTIPADCVYGVATSCQVPETTAFVNTNPNLDHPSWSSFTTAGSGNDNANMLIVNGGGDASQAVWKQSLGVTAYETYQFTGWAASNYIDNPGVLEALFNGVSAGDAFTVTQVGTWAEFTFDWYSGSATTLNLALLDLETAADGNDFSLTNFSLEQTSVPEPASAAALIVGLSVVTVIRLRRRRRG